MGSMDLSKLPRQCRRGRSWAPSGARRSKLRETTVIDDDVVAYLKTTVDLAPLHQPPAIAGIERSRRAPSMMPCRLRVSGYCIFTNAVGGGIDVRGLPEGMERTVATAPVWIPRAVSMRMRSKLGPARRRTRR